MTYVLKLKPEDFVVEELREHRGTEGRYLIIRGTKRSRTTSQAAHVLAKSYNLPDKDIGYAGMKDKDAVTTQYFSVPTTRNDLLRSTADFIWQAVGRAEEPISLGQHEGNAFTITVRNLDTPLKPVACYPNYFDEQRFSKTNVTTGIALLKGDFKAAVETLQENPRDKHLLSSILNTQPTNFIGALQLFPPKRLRLFVHAVQSRLFNELLAHYIRTQDTAARTMTINSGTISFPTRDIPQKDFPLVGFGTPPNENDEYIDGWLKEHDITRRSFIIRPFPGASSEGNERQALVAMQDLEISPMHEDQFHPGKKKQTVTFILPSGSYATMVIRALSLRG